MSEAKLPVTFDSMRREDLPEILVIEHLSFSEPWTEEMFLHEVSSEGISDLLVARANAESGPRIAGFLCAWIVAKELHINNIAVHPGYRRRGIASQLLLEMLRRARVKGATAAYLEVRASNDAAKALYQRYGFKLIGRRRNYYDRPREDAILMSRELL